MSSAASFETFEKELARLVASFSQRLAELQQPTYGEAQLRADFLDPFFAALGWDLTNRSGLIQKHREVEIESRTEIAGRKKRADYLFRTDTRDRLVCEAKKPAVDLIAKYAFQAKRYAWNKDLALAVLSDFEELKIYIVGGRPRLDEPLVGLWKTWHFQQFPAAARELWELLARDQVAGGSIARLIDALWGSVPADADLPLHEAWAPELERRIAGIQSGSVKTVQHLGRFFYALSASQG